MLPHYSLRELLDGIDGGTTVESFAEYLTEVTKEEHYPEHALHIVNRLVKAGYVDSEGRGIGENPETFPASTFHFLTEKGLEYKGKEGFLCTKVSAQIIVLEEDGLKAYPL